MTIDASFSSLSYALYLDSALTSPFTNLLQLIHKSDLSDGDQDFVIYLGSTTASRVLKTTTNPGTDNITVTPVLQLPSWAASTAYSLGQTVRPTVANGFRYVVTTAGTSDATEPSSWPTSGIGSTVSDGTVVWTLVAETHAITEIKLALTSGGLDTATAGAALSLGTSIDSGSANAVAIHIRITNAVVTVSKNTGYAELGLSWNGITEEAA